MAGRKRKAAGGKPALEFKSATLTVPLLSLLGNDMGEIARQLAQKVAQSPTFFHDSPLLIDLQALARQKLDIEVDVLIMLVREQGFLPVGIRGGTEAQHNDALMLNVPVLPLPTSRPGRESDAEPAAEVSPATPAAAPGSTPVTPVPAPATAGAPPAVSPAAAQTAAPAASPEMTAAPAGNKLITQPVRSGQRVYARGDLTVMATVSAGAEILAEGNIHVYGSLRGRALAGVRGDESSRIFCMDLQAELVSIAGIYQLRDDQQARPGRAVAISLENQALVVKEL